MKVEVHEQPTTLKLTATSIVDSEILEQFCNAGVTMPVFNRSYDSDDRLPSHLIMRLASDRTSPTTAPMTTSPDRIPIGTRVTAAPTATSPTLFSIRNLATPLPTSDATLVLTYLLRYDKHAHVENVIMDIISRTQKE